NAEARYRLAMMLARGEYRDKAVEQLRAAIEADPGHVQALTALGIHELDMGNFEESVTLLERAVAAGPDYALAQDALTKAQARLTAIQSYPPTWQ
ncbi:MAG: tetratricopeptide repeat protein, partial [Candidatus Hydrogenedentes bacterium]|nr:tetratricopeptide repeat protein [Candidatus Hydrogenedentota bacterium]